METIPPKLAEIIEDFSLSEGREKLELLLQYADSLPPLPAEFQNHPERMKQVHECMTPVFIQAKLDQGQITYFFDVPAEAPTVRGFAAVMGAGINGSTPAEVLAIPADFYTQMGLDQVLTQRRLNGISAILVYMKRLAS
jgi:cysteine desulfuration protein SufE